MSRHRTLLLSLSITLTMLWILGVAAGAVALQTDDGPRVYTVRIGATTHEERSAIAHQGIAIDFADDRAVLATVSEEELQFLREEGFPLLEVQVLQFPIEDEGYHTYAETLVEITQAATDHPDIVQIQSIGQSIENRDIYAVKISDNVAVDEAEPEVLLFSLTHAREHLTTEQALDLIAHFTDNYAVRGDITNLVNEREIWILPNVNPDGDEYDRSRSGEGWYWGWRKNRRDNGDGTWGVDLNRNYGYRWGYNNGGSSPYSSSDTYRGPSPFSEPESQVIRDFAFEHPDLVASISFHTYGELILWPYGYTYEDVPEDMSEDDHAVFATMGRSMAATNGYTAVQASDLYPTNGDSDDWLYGELGIFAFTFEMYPSSAYPGHYSPDDVIPAETARNREAASYLIGVSDNPYKVIGQGGDVAEPLVALSVPSEGAEISGTVTISATASDDFGVTLVEFKLDGTTLGLDASAPYTATWDSSTDPGEHSLLAQAYDHGQNIGISTPVRVWVRPADPPPTATVTPTAAAPPTATATATPTVRYSLLMVIVQKGDD